MDGLLQAESEAALKSKLIANGKWEPFAFIEFCKQAAGKPDRDPQNELARKIQGLESEVLLEHFVS